MKTITFSDNELEELKRCYQFLFEKTSKRLEDIKNIIDRLNGPVIQALGIDLQTASKERIKGVNRKRRKERKIPWKKFIPKLLKKENRILNINDIAELAIQKYNLSDRAKTIRTLSVTLPRLTKQGILKSSRKPDQRINFYGLTFWESRKLLKSNTVNEGEKTLSKEKQTVRNYIRKTNKTIIPWRTFIPEIIKKEGSQSIHDLAEAALIKYNHTDEEKVLKTLNLTLARMTKSGKLTFDRQPGQKTHLYGLPLTPSKIKSTNGTEVESFN